MKLQIIAEIFFVEIPFFVFDPNDFARFTYFDKSM